MRLLQIGDSIKYYIFHTSCISGDKNEPLDSVCFFRDSKSLKALYHSKNYLIEENTLIDLSDVESMMSITRNTEKSSYYNYIISFQGNKGLIGVSNRNTWDKLINLFIM